MKKYIIIGITITVILLVVYFTSLEEIVKPYEYGGITLDEIKNSNNITLFHNEKRDLFYWYFYDEDVTILPNGGKEINILNLFPKQELAETYNQIKNTQNTVVINPIFTAVAYNTDGFYYYYSEKCDESCLTVTVNPLITSGSTSSYLGLQVLYFLQYNIINDLDVHLNPNILDEYDKVIVLHNEYVTQTMFDAITKHPNVIYLYPNALYAEVEYDAINNTITLIRGHGYPTSDIGNGFEWEFENTHPFEYDTVCNNWEFYEIENGKMLNCYPDYAIIKDFELLQQIKLN